MKNVLTSSQITLETRMRILRCQVWSTLLYGSETFTINGTTAKNIEAFEMWTIRSLLTISWKKKVTNETVLRKAKVGREMLKILKVKNMRYFGHIIRQEGMQKKLLEGKVNGKRPIEEDQEHAE